MSDNLKNIDLDLIALEDRLLAEHRRLRKLDSAEVYSQIDPALHEELKLIYSALLEALQAIGDWANLSLKSEEQEWIEDRMRTVRNLLVRKLPTAFLAASHQEHKATGSSKFGTDAHYASEVLDILDKQVARHQVDGRTIEEVMQERAEFNSKELSKGHAQDSRSKIAQPPEEIRNKPKGSTGAGGPSTFVSRDLGGSTSGTVVPQKPAPAAEKSTIAQSPDEIRQKLAQRQTSSTGKATFGSKDVVGMADKMPTPTPSGKAVFGSKDIESISDKFPAENKKKEEPPKPKAGPAVFESKDLSNP
jgi:hypothetical protein